MTQVQVGGLGGLVLGIAVVAGCVLLFVYADRYALYSKNRAERMYGALMSRQFTRANVRLGASGGLVFGVLVVILCTVRLLGS
ncbi:hypothetical protein GCM10027413_29440 [Conyzicola nivalis]|uniref:Uncharacterized protein n=1 Tax=Conyzicola nivalis TaxID=1477021 RepID=A0A916WLL8_9MICO|nr:hypothetical protein [Conyzicola nivalis]GGB13598.1 hypothetical protein GCM10010979_30070 [Conyzicola nivalis]